MRHANDSLTCREFVELVTDYLEEALPGDVRAAIELHLDVCSGCRLYLGQMRLAIRSLHEPRTGQLPDRARTRLREAFRAWSGTALDGG